jgi:hypothetical protein
MIKPAIRTGVWVIMLVLAFSTFAQSQHLLKSAGQDNKRITPRSVSTTIQRGNTSAHRSKPGDYKIRSGFMQRTSPTITARTSATLDCDGFACIPATPLPVTLIKFYGERSNSVQVQLNWTTSEEVNNDHFKVERTLNPANGFQVVASVKGKTNSAENTSYQVTDPNNEEVYTYYRLAQYDLDGSRTYSRIIAVKGFIEPLSVIPFPNPARSQDLKFRVTGHKTSESLNVQVFDVKGNNIYQNNAYFLTEDQQILLPGMKHQPGSFVIKIKNQIQQASSSFIMIN